MKRTLLIVLPFLAMCFIGCGPPDPETLYMDLGCPRCHGFHLEGNRYGPALDRLGENWDSAPTIVRYLRDPETVVEDDARLKAQDADYSLKMQPITDASNEELTVLTSWLLESE